LFGRIVIFSLFQPQQVHVSGGIAGQKGLSVDASAANGRDAILRVDVRKQRLKALSNRRRD